jgi:hypothetical protein
MKNTTILMILSLCCCAMRGAAQPVMTGATCVVPGTTYQYLISGNWDSASTMEVCTTGGVVALLNGPCTGNSSPVASLLIVWNAGVGSGSLQLTSSKGNTSFSVTITRPLRAGTITTVSKLQSVGFNGVPTVIHCSPDTGGSCSPVYAHQWQQSRDNVHWTDINLANGNDLTVLPAQKQTIFFRRKTVETGSGSIDYSDAAAVMVGPPPPGTSAANMN